MDINEFLPNMPQVAQEAFSQNGVTAISLGNGVSRLEMSGHDRGVSFRFFMHPVYNPATSVELGYEVFDPTEMIEWTIDRKNKPVEMVRFLPEGLLKWNRVGELIGGRYKEAYLAWKTGKDAPGTPLRKWGQLSDSEIASLEAESIFTVEQFSEIERGRIVSRFPKNFVEAHERASLFLAAKEVRAKDGELVERLRKVEEEKAALEARLAALEAKAVEKDTKVVEKQKTFNLESKK